MLAYHNDPAIKAMFIDRVTAHEQTDEILQSYGYWNDGRGCAVGCTIHGDTHEDYESELGIPTALAYLEDRIFEQLPAEKAKTWPRRFLEAVQPGQDLSLVSAHFMIRMLSKEGVLRHVDAAKFPEVVNIIGMVSQLYNCRLAGDEPTTDEWNKAEAEAEAAARAARAAAWAAAWAAWAARAAARAARAARAAAWAAWAARAAAEAAEYEKMSEWLLDAIREAPIGRV